MLKSNRHMNIFEHYTQAGAMPIENNISRGLAILLESNPLLFDRFLEMVNTKCADKNSNVAISKPQKQEEREIGYQQRISDIVLSYPSPKSVVGLTLTTTAPINMLDNSFNNNSNLITDIIIFCRDALIVIEVKRNATDARNQVGNQVDSLIKEIVGQGNPAPEREILDGTWEELITVLQDVSNLIGYNTDTILGHYLQHLENNYQDWFPVSLLNEGMIEEANGLAVEKRIVKIIQNCCEKENEEKKYSGRNIIPIDYDFTNEAQIWPDYEHAGLIIKIWLGDTKSQGRNLFNQSGDMLSWLKLESLDVNGDSLQVSIIPYLRLAHFQSPIVTEPFDEAYYKNILGYTKNKYLNLFNDISRSWKRADWPQLVKLLKSKYRGIINDASFDAAFATKFENSNRSYADVTFGFATSIFLPEKLIGRYESSVKRGDDKLAEFINLAIKEFLGKIH